MENIMAKSFIDLAYAREHGLTYQEYRQLVSDLWERGLTTEKVQDPAHFEFTKLNIQRMKRLDHTIQLRPAIIRLLSLIKSKVGWIVITEGWCGDSSQNVPWINKMEEIANGKIEVFYLLRDENLKIMDEYLTNGARAIPKLICFNFDTGEVLFSWGPRPIEIQRWYVNHKKNKPEIDKKDRDVLLHQLYTSNKGEFIQDDFEDCLLKCI